MFASLTCMHRLQLLSKPDAVPQDLPFSAVWSELKASVTWRSPSAPCVSVNGVPVDFDVTRGHMQSTTQPTAALRKESNHGSQSQSESIPFMRDGHIDSDRPHPDCTDMPGSELRCSGYIPRYFCSFVDAF
jgi:hypothetical protein